LVAAELVLQRVDVAPPQVTCQVVVPIGLLSMGMQVLTVSQLPMVYPPDTTLRPAGQVTEI
jgi:hypothetical protein